MENCEIFLLQHYLWIQIQNKFQVQSIINSLVNLSSIEYLSFFLNGTILALGQGYNVQTMFQVSAIILDWYFFR